MTPQEHQGLRDVAANTIRYGSGAIQLPAGLTPWIGVPAYSGIGAGSEYLAQTIQNPGAPIDYTAVAGAAAVPPLVRGGVAAGKRALPWVATHLPGAASAIQAK